MRQKVLRPCSVCRRPYQAKFFVMDMRFGKLYLCRACWEAFQAGQLRLNPDKDTHDAGDNNDDDRPTTL
jgi:hypothetical protein